MEDELNGRHHQWKINLMEDNLKGRGSQGSVSKTTSIEDISMEDDLNGRQPQGKRFSGKSILMEVNLFGSLTGSR